MSEFPTRLETDETPNPTVLESPQGVAKTKLEAGAASVRGTGLRKDDVFAGYRVLERLRVVSLEAELYVVERVDAPQQRFTLKLYRPEFRPREDILNKVRSLRREHIVETIETGTVDESFYEIQEYVAYGSLADMIRTGALSEAKTKEALEEIATALAHLHEVDVLHRDIKPSNILVRTTEPKLDLVLTDFGLSRETDMSFVQASRLGGTAAYSAPEASTKGLVKKSDWWSVGMIVIEMLTGRHPFSGISDLAISMHVATRPVAIPESLSAEWKLIIKGLLTRDPQRRWGFEQVSQWLEGKRDIAVSFESGVTGAPALDSHRPYRFSGQDHFRAADLAVALTKNWDEAVKRVGRLSILSWVRDDLRDDDMTNALQDVADDTTLNEYHKLALTLIILNPELPLIWEDQVVDLAWMRSRPDKAVAMLDSALPTWLHKLRNENWMVELQRRRREIWKALPSDVPMNRELAEQLILGPPEVAHAQARVIRSATFSSEEPVIDQLLRIDDFTDANAILLVACNRQLLWSKDQEAQFQIDSEATRVRSEVSKLSADFGKAIRLPTLKNLLGRPVTNARFAGHVRRVRAFVNQASSKMVGSVGDKYSKDIQCAFQPIEAEIDALSQSFAIRRRADRRKALMILAGIIAGALGITVLSLHLWMLSKTRLEFRLEDKGEPIKLDSSTTINWDGLPFTSGERTSPRRGLFKIVSDIYEPVEGYADVRYGQTNVVGPIQLGHARGNVSVRTEPSGAEIVYRGKKVGKTPMTLTDAAAGPIQVTVKLANYYSATLSGQLISKHSLDLFERLTPIYGRRMYTVRPFHLRTWGRGPWYNDRNVPVGDGVDVQLLYADIERSSIELTFRVTSKRTTEVLLYARDDLFSKDLWGKTEQVSERLYIVDNLGRKFPSTSGFVGGRQERFNDRATSVKVYGGESVLLKCKFPMISPGAKRVKFVSPSPDHGGHQSEWSWDDIDVFDSADAQEP